MEDHGGVVVIGAATMDTKGLPQETLRPGSSCEGDIRISVGGVARNIGVVRALEKAIGMPVVVSPHAQVTGAIGAAVMT